MVLWDIHLNMERLKCDHCEYNTPRKADLQKHLTNVHFPNFPPRIIQKRKPSSSLSRKTETAEDVIAEFTKRPVSPTDEIPVKKAKQGKDSHHKHSKHER